jgi:hypothetical protein
MSARRPATGAGLLPVRPPAPAHRAGRAAAFGRARRECGDRHAGGGGGRGRQRARRIRLDRARGTGGGAAGALRRDRRPGGRAAALGPLGLRPDLEPVHAARQAGKVAMDAARVLPGLAGVLPGFAGVAVHDGWSPYWRYEQVTHAMCGAHHSRAVRRQPGRAQLPFHRPQARHESARRAPPTVPGSPLATSSGGVLNSYGER